MGKAHLKFAASKAGFSLVELMLVLVVGGIVTMSASKITIMLTEFNKENENQRSTATYRQDLKLLLKRLARNAEAGTAAGESMCMAYLADFAGGVVGATGNTVIEIGSPSTPRNILTNGGSLVYGELQVARTYLTNIVQVGTRKSYVIDKPRMFNIDPAAGAVEATAENIIIKQADLRVEFIYPNKTAAGTPKRPEIQPLKVNFAIQNGQIKDCGTRNIARATAMAEACKALGEDFELVQDGTPSAPAGRCYAPVYDPPSGFSAWGSNTEIPITGYTPFEEFFCLTALRAKGWDLPFCTREPQPGG